MATSLVGEVIKLFSEGVKVKYVHFSVPMLVFYDVIINLADEVKYVWKSRWSPAKVLYLAARYSAVVGCVVILTWIVTPDLTPQMCKRLNIAMTWLMLCSTVCSELILALRTYAIWEKSKWILTYLLVLELGLVIFTIIVLQNSLNALRYIQSPAPTVLACVPSSKALKFYPAFACVMAYDLNILLLTVWKAVKQSTTTPLFVTLLRDGFLNFAIIFTASLANLLCLTILLDTVYYNILLGLQLAFHAIFSSRLIISMRKAAKKSNLWFVETHDSSPIEMSETCFAYHDVSGRGINKTGSIA